MTPSGKDETPQAERAEKRAKALKLLEAMVEPCKHQQKSGEHEWRKCRRCLAHNEADSWQGVELLAVLLAELLSVPAVPAHPSETTKDDTRQRTPDVPGATGSPRSQPDGCERCNHQSPGYLRLLCDREVGHGGDHRGYVEEHDDVLFWRQK